MKKLLIALFVVHAPFVFSEKTKSGMQEQLPPKENLTVQASSLQEGYEKIIQKRAKLGLDTLAIINHPDGSTDIKSTFVNITIPSDFSNYNKEVYKIISADNKVFGTIEVVTPNEDFPVNFTPSIPLEKGL